jgi:hypothetical protein
MQDELNFRERVLENSHLIPTHGRKSGLCTALTSQIKHTLGLGRGTRPQQGSNSGKHQKFKFFSKKKIKSLSIADKKQ